ncbi:MAG: hypothetical protein ABIA63_04120 [bacterium]
MRFSHLILSGLLITGLTVTGTFGEDRVDKRQERQHKRIEQGVKNGSITKEEAARLIKEQRKIKRAERRAKSDGELSKHERKTLEKRQDKASRHIASQKHDKQIRGGKEVNVRQKNQRKRIMQGVKSGELTRDETKGLIGQQRKINRAEHRAKADGKLTKKERIALDKAQDRTSKAIYKQKHDDEKREKPSADGSSNTAENNQDNNE